MMAQATDILRQRVASQHAITNRDLSKWGVGGLTFLFRSPIHRKDPR